MCMEEEKVRTGKEYGLVRLPRLVLDRIALIHKLKGYPTATGYILAAVLKQLAEDEGVKA
jgi:hypothetical protein